MLYVQHLLGIGHLNRSLQLAAALVQQGLGVTLVSGGMPARLTLPDGVQFRQLDPTYCADASFARLLDADGNEIDERWKTARKNQLLDMYQQINPQVLITETFPFGRRMMRFELLPLLEVARSDGHCQLIISSIRDILQPKSKPGRNLEICELVDAYYDHVMVHGDPQIARLEDSFAMAARISGKVFYSGYITATAGPRPTGDEGLDEVLVSAGGSATGLSILETAIAARPHCSLAKLNWRILVSPAVNEAEFKRLRSRRDTGITIERNRPDFNALLQHCRLSISQAGYNTVTDILGSGKPAIVIPFDQAGEVEQTMRAQTLQRSGRLLMLRQKDLTTASLAAAIDRSNSPPASICFDLNGAASSARTICQWLDQTESDK